MNSMRDDNFSQAELDKFNELAHRWWGEPACLRASGGRSHAGERPAALGRAGTPRRDERWRCVA